MSTYIFGDIHGCYEELLLLLKKIKYIAGTDSLCFSGDMIGRGPMPVETIEFIMGLKKLYPETIHCVLGNHDLNFLAASFGFRKLRKKDNLDALIESPILPDLQDFYIHTPLMYIDTENKFALTHAGVFPKWSLEDAKAHSIEISKVLSDPINRKIFLANMYGDFPTSYDESLKQSDLCYWRFISSAFTRMRLCSTDLELDFGHSSCPIQEAAKDNVYPWFNFSKEIQYKKTPYTLFFGHWASLKAQCDVNRIEALDTGCVWGNKLTCFCIDTGKRISVNSQVQIEFSTPNK